VPVNLAEKSELTKLCHMTCHKVAIITYVQLLWGTAPLKLSSAKTSQICCHLEQLSNLTANISGTGI